MKPRQTELHINTNFLQEELTKLKKRKKKKKRNCKGDNILYFTEFHNEEMYLLTRYIHRKIFPMHS